MNHAVVDATASRLRRRRSTILKNDVENSRIGKRTKNDITESKEQRRPLQDIYNKNIPKPKISMKRSILAGRMKRKQAKNVDTKIDKDEQTNEKPQAVETNERANRTKEDLLMVTSEDEIFVNIAKRETEWTKQNNAFFKVEYYVDQIYDHLFDLENRFKICKDHLQGQEFTANMRSILVNWIVEVVNVFSLLQETLQLTIYILDKFMSARKTTTKDNAQLIGMGALFIATKYEETEPIAMTDLIKVCNSWSPDDIRQTEREILEAVDYELGKPLPIHFIRRLSERGAASPMEHNYAKYFADSSLLCYKSCYTKSSTIAAASIFLALCISREKIDTGLWTTQLIAASRHNIVDFSHLLSSIAKIVTVSAEINLNALHTRYSTSDLYCVSLMPGCQPGKGIINNFCVE